MPELPDVVVYLEALERRILHQPLDAIRLSSPFVLRSVDPPVADVVGRRVTGLRRMGKRLVWALEDERFVVIHLMIAGRLRWAARGGRPPGRIGLAAFDFPSGSVLLTIPAGTASGAKLRLRGKGIKRADGSRGDQIGHVQIVVPKVAPDDAETRKLVEELDRRTKGTKVRDF